MEALLFVAGTPLTIAEICAAADLAPDDAKLALGELQSQYEREGRGLRLRFVAGGYQLCTRAEYAPYIESLLGGREKNVLSQAFRHWQLWLISNLLPGMKLKTSGV